MKRLKKILKIKQEDWKEIPVGIVYKNSQIIVFVAAILGINTECVQNIKKNQKGDGI